MDPLSRTNDDRDPQAAPRACSSPGVNGSNRSLINHINSNWLLIACSVVLGRFASFSHFPSYCFCDSEAVKSVDDSTLAKHYVIMLAASEKRMLSKCLQRRILPFFCTHKWISPTDSQTVKYLMRAFIGASLISFLSSVSV